MSYRVPPKYEQEAGKVVHLILKYGHPHCRAI